MFLQIQPLIFQKNFYNRLSTGGTSLNEQKKVELGKNSTIPPFTFHSINEISFTSKEKRVPDIRLEEYRNLSEKDKAWLRERCENFEREVNPNDLFIPKNNYLPLSAPNDAREFVELSKSYNQFKDHPIICIGRSPKWPLNASQWMQEGIDGYKFAAFSKFWYKRIIDPDRDSVYLVKDASLAPTLAQEAAYKKYLTKIGATPKDIVEMARKSGKQTVITDYVETSKGITSFLDLLSRFAKEQGILEDFTKSIILSKIGSDEYTANKVYPDFDTVPARKIILPETMKEVIPRLAWGEAYPKQIKADMPANILEQMILNRNANECRSDFYPKEKWLQFIPSERTSEFTKGMRDLRNLLNFKILDYLNAEKLIKRL